MEILPQTIPLPTSPIARSHTPSAPTRKDGHRAFRQCIRWEFGFTCALCLLHESDLFPAGVEGVNLTWIEHYELRSTHPALANAYTNCLYSCMLCNHARLDSPVHGPTGSLLNPCSVAWASRFIYSGDFINPVNGDADAQYTHQCYRLNDPRKVELRRFRREQIAECLHRLRPHLGRLSKLQAVAKRASLATDSVSRQTLSLAQAKMRRLQVGSIDPLLRRLARFRAIPQDSRTPCACNAGVPLQLPTQLATHCVSVPDPP